MTFRIIFFTPLVVPVTTYAERRGKRLFKAVLLTMMNTIGSLQIRNAHGR